MSQTAVMIGFLICVAISAMIVNGLMNMYMKFIGADSMLFNGKHKVIAIIVVALVLETIVVKFFGWV